MLKQNNKTQEIKKINQKELTSECWSIQIWGMDYCDICPYKDTEDCGGENIRKTGKNELGYEVPLK